MIILYILVLVVVAVGAWLWRGRYEYRKSEQFILAKQDATAKAKNLLEELRKGKQREYFDDFRLVENLFDSKYVSLVEIGTTLQELKKLFTLSGARWEARLTAERLHTEIDKDTFEYYVLKMPDLLVTSGLTAEELDVTNIEKLRRAMHVRRANISANEARSQLHEAYQSIVSMDRSLFEASADVSEITWVGEEEKLCIKFLREKLAATPTKA